jgi:structural maintenance of chromosome 2
MKSVTYDGDVYDPSGQLTGGAKSNSAGVLLKLQVLKEKKLVYGKILKDLSNVNDKLSNLKIQKQLYNSLQEKKELKEHELELVTKRMNNNPHFKIIQRVEELIAEHTMLKDSLSAEKDRMKNVNENIQTIEREMSEFNNDRESKVKDLEKQLKEKRNESAKLQPTVEKMKEQIMLSKEESRQIELEIKGTSLNISALDVEIEQAIAEESRLDQQIDQLKVFKCSVDSKM